MTIFKGLVVVSPESTSKSRIFDSIKSKHQFLAPFEKFCLDGKEEAKRGGGNTEKSWKECDANNIP